MKDWKYIVYIASAIGLFIIVKLMSPKEYNWNITLAHQDKNPYGAYALNALLPTSFPDQPIKHSYKTLYELKDSLAQNENVFILSYRFSPSREDTRVLLEHVNKGGTAIISAQSFYGTFADTLKLDTQDYLFKNGFQLNEKDTAVVKFSSVTLDTTQQFYYRRKNIYNYFSKFDTTRTTEIARNDEHVPITIRVKWGKGSLILNSTPLAFTNIYILSKDNHFFASTLLSYLAPEPVRWTEFYHVGRMEITTPLRFILLNEPLSWAYYLTVFSILIFMIFEAKRKQRIIPIIKPLANTTLEFVATIGNLYYQHGDHKNIAEKKIIFFLELVRVKYSLNTQRLDEQFIQALSRKSGRMEEEVRQLVKLINTIRSWQYISEANLIDLNDRIEQFNK